MVSEARSLVPWSTDRRQVWLESVADWVGECLGSEVDADGLETVKLRPWGAVLSAATPSGVVFFKAVGPRGRHETTVLVDIAALQSRLAPTVIAVDHARGWLLMADHGDEISRSSLDRQVVVIEALLPTYAEAQRRTADRTDQWIAAGVPDRTPRRLPALLDKLLAGHGRSGPLPVAAEEMTRFAEALDVFVEVCDVLGEGPAPMAIDHADIHGTNVLLGPTGPRLIDWGDSCIGHPFSSLLVPLEWVVGRLSGAARDRAAARLIDAYLEPWGDGADRPSVGLAVWAGYIARAVSNDEQSSGGSPTDVANAQDEIVALLRSWEAKRTLVETPAKLVIPTMRW